jgi:hypothetical protein
MSHARADAPESSTPSACQALVAHQAEVGSLHLLFANDPGRGERLVVEAAGVYLDCSKNRVTDETMRRLVALAEACDLGECRAAMFRGDAIRPHREALSAARGAAHEFRLLGLGRCPLFDGFGDRPVDLDRDRAGEFRRHAHRLRCDARALPQRADREGVGTLNAMDERFRGRVRWTLAFSFARAIQQSALEIWCGEAAHVGAARQALFHRADCNRAAQRGDYDASAEAPRAA